MRKFSLASLAMAAALAITPAVMADSFSYTISGSNFNGNVTFTTGDTAVSNLPGPFGNVSAYVVTSVSGNDNIAGGPSYSFVDAQVALPDNGAEDVYKRQLLEHVIRVCGEERVVPVVVPAAVDTAIIVVADADEGLGIGHRQVMEQDGIDQREDGRVCADAEGQRQEHGNGKTRRLAQLAKCVVKILDQNPHAASLEPCVTSSSTLHAVRCSI